MAWASIDDGEDTPALDLDYAKPASSAFEAPDGKTFIEAVFALLTLLALWAPGALSNAGADVVTDPRRKVSQILVEDEALAQELFAKISCAGAGAQAMDKFGDLAKKHSLRAPGHLEEVRVSEMPTEFTNICSDPEQPTGVPIGPVRTAVGYHIIMLEDVTKAEDGR